MLSKNIIPMAGLELGQEYGGVARTDHSVSAFGSSIGTLIRCSIGLDMLKPDKVEVIASTSSFQQVDMYGSNVAAYKLTQLYIPTHLGDQAELNLFA